MATFNSVLIGKAKGKVGNIVLTSIKGQNIVKSLNDKPANPRSVGQTENRAQMANAVLAWQFLALFFAYATALTKSTESVYNAFVRLVKSSMSTIIIASRVVAAEEAFSAFISGNWFSCTGFTYSAIDGTSILFDTNGLMWRNTYVIVYCSYSADGQNFLVNVVPLNEVEFNSGSAVVNPILVQAVNNHGYIYDTASNKITNII
jgi:hypothetical protein